MKRKEPASNEYQEFLAQVRQRILGAWQSAARAVNKELISLYWDLGRHIVETQAKRSWGDGVLDMLARDLKKDFPTRGGFSERNLRYVRAFWRTYSDPLFRQQAVAELEPVKTGEHAPVPLSPARPQESMPGLLSKVPWGQHVVILDKANNLASRLFYLRATAQYGWTRNVLHHMIAARTFEHSQAEGKAHNFEAALPEDLAEQAEEALRSSYSVDFLGLRGKYKERELESRMVERVRQFMLQLGYGFCFIDRQYRLMVGESEFFIDLLFYHRFLKALVAIELKAGPFKPEHAGKMDFYLNVLNDHVRAPDDNPSIGIILCTGKDDLVVEYSLKTKGNPIGVAHYEVTSKLPKELKGRLPSAEELRRALTPADDAAR